MIVLDSFDPRYYFSSLGGGGTFFWSLSKFLSVVNMIEIQDDSQQCIALVESVFDIPPTPSPPSVSI